MSRIEEIYQNYLKAQQKIGDDQKLSSVQKSELVNRLKESAFNQMQNTGEVVPKNVKVLNFVKDIMTEKLDSSKSAGQISRDEAISQVENKIRSTKKEAIADKLGPMSDRLIDPESSKLLQGTTVGPSFAKKVLGKVTKSLPVVAPLAAGLSALSSPDVSASEVAKEVGSSLVPDELKSEDLGPKQGSLEADIENPALSQEMRKKAIEQLMKR